jgi:tRNA 2-thiouridine synthesizing protein E
VKNASNPRTKNDWPFTQKNQDLCLTNAHPYSKKLVIFTISIQLLTHINHIFQEEHMAQIEHNGTTYEVDEDGFLLKGADDWDENWIDYVKGVEGIPEITDEHQKVIDALQEYYKKNGIAPMVRILSKTTGFPLKRIYELFPSGPGKGACKMAGLPKPTGCV